jgi:signal transduction histidine kinase
MNRPRAIWLGFALCLLILLTATGWVTWTALSLEKEQSRLREVEATEEQVRLALWRMDSMLAPLIAQESGRPYFAYKSFYPADLAYGKSVNTETAPLTKTASKTAPTSPLVPSPLLTQTFSNVILYFQYDQDGRLTSPQLPMEAQRTLALKRFVTEDELTIRSERLREFDTLMRQTPASRSPSSPPLNCNRESLFANLPAPDTRNLAIINSLQLSQNSTQLPTRQQRSPSQSQRQQQQNLNLQQVETASQGGQSQLLPQQYLNNQREAEIRNNSVQQAILVNFNNAANFVAVERTDWIQGPLKAVWIGDTLVLARRVSAQGRECLQGCWLDWPALQRSLLTTIIDLCPNATLTPVSSGANDPQGRTLVSLPARLVPGRGVYQDANASPVKLILITAWAGALLALAAVAALLHGVVSLSERRAMFVSSVSHELRTPLTTFKMYSEMLAADMVPDESSRRDYLRTLCSEANRLGHLVENVLAYARLERGSARAHVEELPAGELLARIKPRLEERASQAGLRLLDHVDPDAAATPLRVDATAVEQILFNLTDNACKYASAIAANKTIEIEMTRLDSRFISIRARDHGPGLSKEALKRLFEPFGKSAQEAAKNAPGVGLGLALCRRLSQSLGGELKLIESGANGTVFELRLPLVKK